jgi:hypothetical protein
MCLDYTSLNKACPKDPYPLPCIDQIVDSTSGCDLLSFLDAYSGFHQIQMSREDRKHIAFCRRSETGGSLSRRVNVAACPSPDGSTRGRARRGEVRWSEMGVREVEIPRPSCSSRAQVGCACSRGLQASTRERERAASCERLSRPRPRAANPL